MKRRAISIRPPNASGSDPSMQSYLHTVTSKVRRTDEMDSRLSSRDGAHFTVKYDGETDQDTWTVVLDVLEEAYREIGQKFGHFPCEDDCGRPASESDLSRR